MKTNPPPLTEPVSARFPVLEEQEVVLTFYAPAGAEKSRGARGISANLIAL